MSTDMTTEVDGAPRPGRRSLDSEQGLLLMVGVLVLLGAAAILAVSGW